MASECRSLQQHIHYTNVLLYHLNLVWKLNRQNLSFSCKANLQSLLPSVELSQKEQSFVPMSYFFIKLLQLTLCSVCMFSHRKASNQKWINPLNPKGTNFLIIFTKPLDIFSFWIIISISIGISISIICNVQQRWCAGASGLDDWWLFSCWLVAT